MAYPDILACMGHRCAGRASAQAPTPVCGAGILIVKQTKQALCIQTVSKKKNRK